MCENVAADQISAYVIYEWSQSKLDPTEVQDSCQLIQRVHLSLQEVDMIREAREINKNYL